MYSSPVEEIKNRLDVVEVIGSYVKLQKAGANYRALCPFHGEKSPSFFVSPARQIWHCFGGCGEGGDMFKFVMRIEGMEFGDALRLLAQKSGVELKPQDPAYQKVQTERNRLHEILELATKFFEKQLASSSTGMEAKKYLQGRGITQESIEKWRLGYAPENAQALSSFLQQQGYRTEEVRKAGLSGQFRSRIMFPIFDLNSQVIGFGGRVSGQSQEGAPKYLNTTNTLVYDKSRVLYGLDKAKLAARKHNSCVLVEGYTDVIMVAQAGCEHVVATSGTALTPSQLQILYRYCDNLSLGFDMDFAGDSATKRGIDLAVAQGFGINILRMPENKDPADIASQGTQEWDNVLEDTESIFDFTFSGALAKFDKTTPEGKRAIANAILPIVKNIPHKIEQAQWVRRLADELETKEEYVYEELEKTQSEQQYNVREETVVPVKQIQTREELLEERVLILIFQHPENLQTVDDQGLGYFSLKIQEILVGLRRASDTTLRSWEELFEAETIAFLQPIALKADLETQEDSQLEKNLKEEFQSCMHELLQLQTKEKLDTIARAIKRAEQEQDAQKVDRLMQEFQVITRSFHGANEN